MTDLGRFLVLNTGHTIHLAVINSTVIICMSCAILKIAGFSITCNLIHKLPHGVLKDEWLINDRVV